MDFEAIIKEHAAMISRIAASYEKDISLRQDVLQEVMMALLVAIPKCREHNSQKAFIARVAQNICLTHVKKAIKNKAEPLADYDFQDKADSADTSLEKSQENQQLQEAVRSLPLNLRQVIILALEGLTYLEIGEAIGISKNNVAVRFNRAKDRLKQIMQSGVQP